MILTIDIGNTNLTAGLFDKEKLVFTCRLATELNRTYQQYAAELATIASLKNVSLSEIDGAMISSVVPPLTSVIKNAVIYISGKTPLILGPGVKSGLNIKIDNPAQLGADLVAGAVAALSQYPLPCLIMDLGTATKISVLDSNGSYLGCTISAGVKISLDALAGSASLLPAINLDNENCPAYGTNTVASMQAGVILGTASMLDGLCNKIEKELGVKVKSVVSTGGYAKSITSHCERNVICDPDLLLKGLRIIYEKNRK